MVKIFILQIVCLILCWCLPAGTPAATTTVPLPIAIDYPFIRSTLIQELYREPGERAVLADDCAFLELWEPEVSSEDGLVKIATHFRVKAGLSLMGTCMGLWTWEGYFETLQQVSLDQKDRKLRFTTVGSRVYDRNRKPSKLGQFVFDLVKGPLYQYFDTLIIDFAPLFRDLKGFLPLVFAPDERKKVERWIQTMRLIPPKVEAQTVRMSILMDIDELSEPQGPQDALFPVPLEELTALWENLDAYFVYQIEVLLGRPLTEKEKSLFMEELLKARYGFLAALGENTVGPDLVRQQFLSSWAELTPILRKYLLTQPSSSLLSYLTFFTAADALAVLDRLGPQMGVEISREGLARLAWLLKGDTSEPALSYTYDVDPRLREFFGLGPPLPLPASDSQTEAKLLPFNFFSVPCVEAADLQGLEKWLATAENADEYTERVKEILEGAAEKSIAGKGYDEEHKAFQRLLVLATAWQESCWRQFITKQGKITYVLSYNNSSVGIMQVNERAWRGLYDLKGLRWNLQYNAAAGGEILELYRRRYILEKMGLKNSFPEDTQAQIAYAMYNGGPGELKKFLKRKSDGSLYKSDRLFWQKYSLVKKGQVEKVAECFGAR